MMAASDWINPRGLSRVPSTARRSAFFASLLLSATVACAGEPAGDGLGVSSWAGWHPRQIDREDCPHLRSVPLILRWNELEPSPGVYRFDEHLGKPLIAAAEDGLHVALMIWVRPGMPEWLFAQGVPRVYTDREVNPLGDAMSKQDNLHAYYLDPTYKQHFFSLIDAFGKYVSHMPRELRERIIFVQSAEGSTGDGQPYKGDPLDKQYAISKPEWNRFRRATWQRYRDAMPGVAILVNSDANDEKDGAWLLEHMDVIALKYGMFSHGYHVSDNRQRLAELDALREQAARRGKRVITRGEQDGEMFVMGWSTRNIPQGLYWSALMATHCGLDVWNVPHRALKQPDNWPAAAFFNRYAGHRDAATAPAAFCALRDGLDAADFERFPASEFGGRRGNKRHVDRYLRIAEAYAPYGARMDDPKKAIQGGMQNRKRSGSNDVGWGIFPGNYQRFISQVDPGSGDVGRWNVDQTIYGRFARAFEHASGKTHMRFQVDEAFPSDAATLRVTYLDQGQGGWSLHVDGRKRQTIRNTDSGKWKMQTLQVSGLSRVELRYESGDDTIFHLIELERGGH